MAILRTDPAAAFKEFGTIPSNSTQPLLDRPRGILLAVANESSGSATGTWWVRRS